MLVEHSFRTWCGRADDIWIASAWASKACPPTDALWRARSQIRALVVGLDFLQTDPEFLGQFKRYARVCTEGATFHPKVYLFGIGRRFACLLGSSNFTAGGFRSNVEANALVEGARSDLFFGEVRARISDLNEDADVLGPELLADYSAKHAARHREIERLRTYVPPSAVRQRLLARRKRAVATSRSRFLGELRSLPHGASLARTVERLLDAIERIPGLRVRWNPQSFSVTYSPSGTLPILLAIVEKRRTRAQAGLGIVHGLMYDGIVRGTQDTDLAMQAYNFVDGLVPSNLPMARQSAQGSAWGIRLSALAGHEEAAATLLTTMAKWLSAKMQ